MIDVRTDSSTEAGPRRQAPRARTRPGRVPAPGSPKPAVADGLGALLARSVLARAVDAPSRDFRMGDEAHELTLVDTPAGPVAVMASTPEDIRVKLEQVHKSLTLYTERLKDTDLATSGPAIELLKGIAALRSKVDTGIGKFDSRKYEKAMGTKPGAWGKTIAVTGVDQEKVDAHETLLDDIAAELVRLATESGIDGLEPHNIEAWVHHRFLKDVVVPKQVAVAKVIAPYIERIQAELPGCAVKFRGSLARGLKSFRKPDPSTGGVQRFDPTKFDADAFIEVSDDDWEVFEGWGVKFFDKLTLARALELATQNADDAYKAKLGRLVTIQSEIQRGLGKVAGYSGKTVGPRHNRRFVADFYLLLQPAAKSEHQIEEGNPYPEGMIEQAGMPELEKMSSYRESHREFDGVAKFLNEIHVEIGSDASLTSTTGADSWI